MAHLTPSNCSIQKESGGIIFHSSPEIIALSRIENKLNNLENKLNTIISLLKDGVHSEPRALEDRRFSSDTDP